MRTLTQNYNLDSFRRGLEFFDLSLTAEQEQQFLVFYEMLIEKNQVMNLTSITEYEDVITKHFLDSLSLCRVVDCQQKLSLLDLGTGAGFPGIPLKIAFPNLQITLVDSLNKRVLFLNDVISELGLSDITAVHGRAEELARNKNYREQFDLTVSRAVANLSTLSEYCLPFVKVGGNFVSYKGPESEKELAAAGRAFQCLGGKLKVKDDFLLPDSDLSRSMVVILKEKNTPKSYPRKAGTPAKEPL